MAKYCKDGCHAVCNFCKFYKDDMEDGDFSGSGICTKKNIVIDASSSCKDDFECFRLD